MRLILASGSPRRRELLMQAGLTFTVETAKVLEIPEEGEAAAAFVLRLAEAKAEAVWSRISADTGGDREDSLVVLGADTCVLSQGEILGKPRDRADAARMLGMLSGRTHQVLTGVAAVTARGTTADAEVTQVMFDLIEEKDLNHYLGTSEPYDKAGAYGIQGYAARWIPRIEGDYFNVVGLPIARTVSLLAEAMEGLRTGKTSP